MASRPALVMGDDGLPQRFQTGDFLPISAGGTGATTAAAALTALGAQPALGYTPARSSTSFGGSIGGSQSMGTSNSYARVAAVSFVATAPNLLAQASFYVGNSGLSAASYAAYVRIVDTTANQVVSTGGTIAGYAAASAGCNLVPLAPAGGLTVGDTITVELWVTSTTSASGTAQNVELTGANY